MRRQLLALALSVTTSLAFGQAGGPEAPPLVSDGIRAALALSGIWEARTGKLDLPFPPPADGWKLARVPDSECARLLDNTPLVRWDDIYSPTLESIMTPDGKGFKDPDKLAAWYRRKFDLVGGVPAGQRALLRCDGIAFRSKVWVNGKPVGENLLCLAPSTYDVTGAVRAGTNELVVGLTSRAALVDMERHTYVAPVAGVAAGIWGDVRLELVPAVRIDDVWVRTLVSRKRIEVDVTLVNAGTAPSTVTPNVVVRGVLPHQTPQVAIKGEPLTLKPGETRTTTLGADWLAPHLWSPATPSLYSAEASTADAGATVDRTCVQFGFREFTAKGRDFLLNGRRQVLLRNSCLAGTAKPRDEIIWSVVKEMTNFNSIRQHIGFINPHILDQADYAGLMVIPEFWGWYRDDDVSFPKALASLWVPNTQETMARVVRQHRNHPSVILWSMANETYWGRTDPALMAIADKLVGTVRANDPTRLLQGDAEVTYGGRLDTINIHYPEGSNDVPPGPADIVGRQYGNAGWVIPNDFAWLKKEGVSRSWRAEFTWDRPLMIGEYHCIDLGDPGFHATWAGDDAYDIFKWKRQDINGRDALFPREDNGWIQMVRMATDHYRAMGVACLNPWTGIGAQIMPSIMVRPLDYHPNAFGGEPYGRRLVVINDGSLTWNNYNDMHVQAWLVMNGFTVWQGKLPAHAEEGQMRELMLTLTPPAVAVPTQARLILRLCCLYGSTPHELYRHEEDVWVMPHASLAGVDPAAVSLVDAENGSTAKALNSLGLKIGPGMADDAALAGKRLLVIGEGAAGKADFDAAARFAERGGRVLVLHQTEMPAFLPAQPLIDPRHAASISWRYSDHPAIAGLEDAQLRWWRPDHLVVTETLARPSSGPALPAVVSGGRTGMHWSPLVEVRHGKGTVTFCQYLLSDRVGVEPAAGMILVQAVKAALAGASFAPAPALRLAQGVTTPTLNMLSLCSVSVTNDPAGNGPILLDAATSPGAEALKRIRSQVEAGGRLWLRGLNEKSRAGVAALLPQDIGFSPLPKGVNAAARRFAHPLLNGLNTSDFYWLRGDQPTCPLGGPAIVPTDPQAAVVLVEPALLVILPLGKGLVLVDQLAWDQAASAETECATRIVSNLARNLGAGFSLTSAKRYRWSYLDLTAKANRSYYDEVVGDGKGGWSDQGDNDMRYFLVNHTGKVGGMAVAGQAFPTEVTFNGVSFKLIDPKANGGKAVLTLRGGPHDPTAPAEARGLAAGNVKADRVWFLHTACWATGAFDTEVARYEVAYADGSRAKIPVRQGREIGDWWGPKPLPDASVAWNGRNEKTISVGIYSMPWDNPNPEKPIANIDVIGNLADTQLVLLAVTIGSEDASHARTTAAWDCGAWANGNVASTLANGKPLAGKGTPAAIAGRSGLRLAGGQCLTGRMDSGPIVEGKPFAVEIEVAPDGNCGGYYGGLVQACAYGQSGMRLVLTNDLKPAAEIFLGQGPGKTTGICGKDPLPTGRFSVVRLELDGTQARLLVNGLIQKTIYCSQPAPWKGGEMCVGAAGGKDYFLNGVVGNIRIQDLGERK